MGLTRVSLLQVMQPPPLQTPFPLLPPSPSLHAQVEAALLSAGHPVVMGVPSLILHSDQQEARLLMHLPAGLSLHSAVSDPAGAVQLDRVTMPEAAAAAAAAAAVAEAQPRLSMKRGGGGESGGGSSGSTLLGFRMRLLPRNGSSVWGGGGGGKKGAYA